MLPHCRENAFLLCAPSQQQRREGIFYKSDTDAPALIRLFRNALRWYPWRMSFPAAFHMRRAGSARAKSLCRSGTFSRPRQCCSVLGKRAQGGKRRLLCRYFVGIRADVSEFGGIRAFRRSRSYRSLLKKHALLPPVCFYYTITI